MSASRFLLPILFLFTLVACGGGGGSTSNQSDGTGGDQNVNNPGNNPGSGGDSQSLTIGAIPSLTMLPIKTIKFDWQDVQGATFYRVMEDADGVSGFSQLGANIASGVGSFTTTIPLHLRVNAQYILQSCNSQVCLDSAIINLADNLIDSIGYFKATNTEEGDSFSIFNDGGTRGSISISTDGTTLAIGTPNEDSADVGINGNQQDNTADNSGAVYVFTRNNSTWEFQAYLKASNTSSFAAFGSSTSLSGDGNRLLVGAIGDTSFSPGINGDQNNNAIVDGIPLGGPGAAYLFTRVLDTWSQTAYIKPHNIPFGGSITRTEFNSRFFDFFRVNNFGRSVAISSDGGTLAIGAVDSSANSGVSPGSTGGFLGGDPADDTFGQSGAVYVYSVDQNSAVSQQAFIKAHNPGFANGFGSDLSLSGDGNTLAVGAASENSETRGVFQGATGGADNFNRECLAVACVSATGAAYVFSRDDSSGGWSQQAYIKAHNTGTFPASGITGTSRQSPVADAFGFSVSLSSDGNTLAVGAPGENSADTGASPGSTGGFDEGAGDSGAVYIFTRLGNVLWSQQAFIKAHNTELDDAFGSSVSLSSDGSLLAVGARREGSEENGIFNPAMAGFLDVLNPSGISDNLGAAYVYSRDINVWSQESYVKPSNNEISIMQIANPPSFVPFSRVSLFGARVALSGDGNTLAVGALENSSSTGVNGNQFNDDAPNSGAVYLY